MTESREPTPTAERSAQNHRLRWRARRGLLENDLLLGPFLVKELDRLGQAELQIFDRLLQLPDNDLLDLLMGRVAPQDPTLTPMVDRIRAASIG